MNFSPSKVSTLPSEQPIVAPIWEKPTIKVKFMLRGVVKGVPIDGYVRQFPGLFPQWGNCLFDFDVDCTDYDWLVVYHDIPNIKVPP